MLHYVYTDTIEGLHWETALKLYRAADKYEILSLKDKCCCFLKDNVRSNNVCEMLLLADLHQDKVLKRTAQDYVLEHTADVMKSREWKKLMETNVTLAAETMYRNWDKD
ncbi:TD and POZ domain-containing protein 3 [Nephila pilipes]|uniref:TD and POZ domain-containing protein 3 n=1 Tax=Nephila pilipes TaxID=299642 RepID=A0A8X6IHF4_NEPPI|nr:TD and POZ domain-containing protein 3 [Nephila pilipes]